MLVWTIAILLAAGCKSTPTEEITPTPTATRKIIQATNTTIPVTKTTPLPVSKIEETLKAVVKIESEGKFNSLPGGEEQLPFGYGSGFILSPNGLVLTQAHAVEGAAKINIYLFGKEDKAYPASIIGIDECTNLALLKIEGENFPYLAWSDSAPEKYDSIFVSGFLGKSEGYDLKKTEIYKIFNKTASGWASNKEGFIYHLELQPSVAGGPIMNTKGALVGLNLGPANVEGFSLGIPNSTLIPFVEQSIEKMLPSIFGINGAMVYIDKYKKAGFWVAAVEKDTPAEEMGFIPGDLITQIGEFVFSEDDNMQTWCNLTLEGVRKRHPEITVYRSRTKEILQGKIGTTKLQPIGHDDNTDEEIIFLNPEASKKGDVYLETDFEQAKQWYSFTRPDTQDYITKIQSGSLYIQVNTINTTVYALYPNPIKSPDVRIESHVKTVAGPNRNNIDLICRATDGGWYEFGMNSGGLWFIWRYDNTDKGAYYILASGGSRVINLQKAENEIVATCIGDELTMYVNGELIGSTHDNKFMNGGQVGVSVSTFDIPGAGVEFDWFKALVP